jgi:uncharacterized protein YuzE
MSITALYDREADALYVTLRDGARTRAIEIDEATYIDIDRDGQALGLEFLYPAMGINLDAVVDRFQLHAQRHSIIAAIGGAGAPGPVPTITGTTVGLMSMSIKMVAVEGTVPASHMLTSQAIAFTHPDRVICR